MISTPVHWSSQVAPGSDSLTSNLLFARKKSKEMMKAEKNEDDKLIRKLETEKLERLLQQIGSEEDNQEEDSLD